MNKIQLVLESLRNNVTDVRTDRNQVKWGSVTLRSARPEGMGWFQFAGILLVLAEDGLFKSIKRDSLGRVRLV